MTQPQLSVVIIFHNAEATLQRTLDSLAMQDFESVEYLFVNDGSNDRSVELIRNYLAINPHFKGTHRLINSEMHRGSAHATMLGITNASGRYIMRVDADDTINPDTFSSLINKAIEESADVVMSDMIVCTPSRCKTLHLSPKLTSLNDMPLDTLHFSLCNKIIRRSLLIDNEIMPFEGVNCWEDLGIVARVMALKPKFAIVDKPLYCYHINPSSPSLSRTDNNQILEDHLLTALMLEQWFLDAKLAGEYTTFLNHLKFCAKIKMLRGRDKDVSRWKATFSEVNSRILSLRHISLYYRLLFAVVAWLPMGITQWIADCCDIFYPKNVVKPKSPMANSKSLDIPQDAAGATRANNR